MLLLICKVRFPMDKPVSNHLQLVEGFTKYFHDTPEDIFNLFIFCQHTRDIHIMYDRVQKYLFYITVLSEVFLFLYMIYPVVMVMCVGHKFLA